MSRLAPSVVSFIALLVAGCEAELPADPTRFHSTLEILVTVDGEPVEGVGVVLWQHTPDSVVVHPPVLTSGAGVVRFGGIPPGSYRLRYEHDEVACRFSIVMVPFLTELQHHEPCVYAKPPILLLFPGLSEFKPDSVRMTVGDTLRVVDWVEGETPPEPPVGTVFAPHLYVVPMTVGCTDVPRDIVARGPLPCEFVAEYHASARLDSVVHVTDSLMETIARILPCARGPDGEPLRPDAWASQGGFAECGTWRSIRTEHGPGIKLISASILVAEDCGRSWVSLTTRTGRAIPWPPPFDGYARLEVEVAC